MIYWAACYTKPLAERDAQRAIEDMGFGTFIPSYRKASWYRGELRSRYYPLMPGYVLVSLTEGDDSWNSINAAPDAFCRVLINVGQPRRISEREIISLTLSHARGDYNVIQARTPNGQFSRQKRRRRRPRHGKTLGNRQRIGTAVTHGSYHGQ